MIKEKRAEDKGVAVVDLLPQPSRGVLDWLWI